LAALDRRPAVAHLPGFGSAPVKLRPDQWATQLRENAMAQLAIKSRDPAAADAQELTAIDRDHLAYDF
jgi:hypothetical protein